MGNARVTMSQPANNTGFTNGGTVSASGTYGTGSNMMGVYLIYMSSGGTEQETSLSYTASAGSWSCSFTLPLSDWRYILCARAADLSDGSTAWVDHFIYSGSPPG
jgi:hypothetical protein